MRMESHNFGHPIYCLPTPNKDEPGSLIFEHWRFTDTGELLAEYKKRRDRVCPKCGQLQTPEGHDPCISNLPGVRNACCGHGVTAGYIQFEDGTVIRGNFTAIERD